MPTDSHKSASLFMLADKTTQRTVCLSFEGKKLDVPAGVSVATALLLSGVRYFRSTPVSSAPRAPYCMMGVCFECLVDIDGRPSRQSCLTQVKDGMVIKCQQGASTLTLSSTED
jgi:predicted molibdopterin-dependent oxidoreductase YjgC